MSHYRRTGAADIERSKAALEYQRAEAITEGFKGDENTLDELIYSLIYAIDGRVHSMDPPSIIDYDIHMLWVLFIEAAKAYNRDNTKQGKLAFQVLYIREMGILTCGREERIVAQASNGQKMWSDLPWFHEDFRAAWEKDQMSIDQRSNLASFMARLLAVGVGGSSFTGVALALFRDTLENPESTDSTLEGLEGLRTEDAALGPLALEAGIENEGFSVSRWEFWTKRIVELGLSEDKKVTKLASDLADAMDMENYRPV